MSGNKRLFVFIFLVLFGLLPGSIRYLYPSDTGKGIKIDEYKAKALCLIRFAQFTCWPPYSSAVNTGTPFVIGILGDSDILSYLSELVEKKPIAINGKKVEIAKLSGRDEVKRCNLIFFSGIGGKELAEILKRIEGEPILTVGESKKYEKKDVMINLFIAENRRVRFNVNRKAAEKSGIDLTSKILKHNYPDPAETEKKRKIHEYKIKALFVIRFAQFARWPPHSRARNPGAPFIIGILGDTHILPYLTEMIEKKPITINGNRVEVTELSGGDAIKKCSIVYFSGTPQKSFDEAVKEIRNLPVLTVGNSQKYEKKDVMISLFIKGGKKIRFKVKRWLADKVGIELTSKILRHAEEIIE